MYFLVFFPLSVFESKMVVDDGPFGERATWPPVKLVRDGL